MKSPAPLAPRLLEALSAYLDGRLEGAERTALEDRLNREEGLRRQLDELRSVRDSLRVLPVLQPPRALTLSRAQVGSEKNAPSGFFRAFSPRAMSFASALAAMMFVFVLAADFFSQSKFALGAGAPAIAQPAAEKAPAMEPTAAKAAAPQLESGGGESPTQAEVPAPTVAPPPSATQEGAYDSDETNGTAGRQLGFVDTSLTSPHKPTLPDYHTVAPYLEAFLGISAVILAVLAVWLRRR
jgi:anti-sigma factor RsiW